ncbi:hypothetical protein Belba_2638 [Belliella baltica DSM 15883]|uniref:Uncharacterized protein n=1 Tax=Belliella baltica (strain DSM 15883 / CIP 108006 / LMG 21964 / BA134) TaxID=866536 RepID=I3Z7G5_BELBD|nr:hypothetical protein Belba_2638 [Belliella baltica DSM 15883]
MAFFILLKYINFLKDTYFETKILIYICGIIGDEFIKKLYSY